MKKLSLILLCLLLLTSTVFAAGVGTTTKNAPNDITFSFSNWGTITGVAPSAKVSGRTAACEVSIPATWTTVASITPILQASHNGTSWIDIDSTAFATTASAAKSTAVYVVDKPFQLWRMSWTSVSVAVGTSQNGFALNYRCKFVP